MRRRRLALVAFCVTAVAGSATAIAATYEAWGHAFTYDAFQPVTIDMAVATEATTVTR